MISKKLLERFYEAANIQRWNDHVRPVELTELDKQAHKMIIAYIIARYEEGDRGFKINWRELIEGCLFEFLSRVVLTDLKPSVFHRMMREKGKELNEYVLKVIDEDIRNLGEDFREKFREYLFNQDYAPHEKRILEAAHYLSTRWEFGIIYQLNRFLEEVERTRREIENRVEDHFDLIGVQKIMLGKKSSGFISLCGQLRFQRRWTGTPRLPQTSVLGHMGIVALMCFLCSTIIDGCEKRVYNNFYAGLFHDLAEVTTRDIISPVKKSVTGLDEIIKKYERFLVEEKILPLLPQSFHQEILYFIEDEFENKIRMKNEVKKGIEGKELHRLYNSNQYSPLDGELVKACDELSAFIEASMSLKYGIRAATLVDASDSIYEKYKRKELLGIPFGEMFDYFR